MWKFRAGKTVQFQLFTWMLQDLNANAFPHTHAATAKRLEEAAKQLRNEFLACCWGTELVKVSLGCCLSYRQFDRVHTCWEWHKPAGRWVWMWLARNSSSHCCFLKLLPLLPVTPLVLDQGLILWSGTPDRPVCQSASQAGVYRIVPQNSPRQCRIICLHTSNAEQAVQSQPLCSGLK